MSRHRHRDRAQAREAGTPPLERAFSVGDRARDLVRNDDELAASAVADLIEQTSGQPELTFDQLFPLTGAGAETLFEEYVTDLKATLDKAFALPAPLARTGHFVSHRYNEFGELVGAHAA